MKILQYDIIAKLFPLFSDKLGKYFLFDDTEILSANMVNLSKKDATGIYTIRRNVAKKNNQKILLNKFQKILEELESVNFDNITSIYLKIKDDNNYLYFLIFSNTEVNKNICSTELELIE